MTDNRNDATSTSLKIADIYVKENKIQVGQALCDTIVKVCQEAIAERGIFAIALSGGSIPVMLKNLAQVFKSHGVDPHWQQWRVLLADERCVPVSHPDSNLGALNRHLLNSLFEAEIPHQFIYGLDQISLGESVEVCAWDYEIKVRTVLRASGGMLDLAVLGFGPDGHTCSLFPGINENLLDLTKKRVVAGITNSPKLPKNRITLTLHALSSNLTRNVVFCGAGGSKAPILLDIFTNISGQEGVPGHYQASVQPKYPCGMVTPSNRLVYIVDQAAMDVDGNNDNDNNNNNASTASDDNDSKTTEHTHNHKQWAHVYVAPSKAKLPETLNPLIVHQCQAAIHARGAFTIALSGGSLPSVLGELPQAFAQANIDPCWDKWHVLLADERCVPSWDQEHSNLGALQQHLLQNNNVKIPANQVYGIDEALLGGDAEAMAQDYEARMVKVLEETGGQLDLAVLGFGPDGHTCSLFPGHELLQERERLVAAIEDSPKPPPKRITMTFEMLNAKTRHVIFCGAGSSKEPVLKQVFGQPWIELTGDDHTAPASHSKKVPIQTDPAPFPCAMVLPLETLTWVVDVDAMPSPPSNL